MTKFTAEQVGQVLCYRLGLDTGTMDSPTASEYWEKLRRDPALDGIIDEVANDLGRFLSEAVRCELGRSGRGDPDFLKSLWNSFCVWSKGVPPRDRSARVAVGVRSGVERAIKARSKAGPAPPKPTGLHPNAGRPVPRPESPKPSPVPAMPPPIPAPSPAAAWLWKPIPDTPPKFPESVATALADPPPDFRCFGARVRGKKHKHDGTNCDDWYEFAREGPWTVIAVADGAGSKALSRVGAQAATRTAVFNMTTGLAGHVLADRASAREWAIPDQPDPETGYAVPDVDAVRKCLHDAMQTAHASVAAEAEKLGADIGDLSCTLLLAVVSEVRIGGEPLHFLMGCQIGDGMIGAVSRSGNVLQVGAADSGGHAGETEFLTSAGKVDRAFLSRKTAVKLVNLQALLVMTDGVADDYFPADDHLPRLWGDLVVNGIPDLYPPSDADIANAFGSTPLTPETAKAFEYGVAAEVVEEAPRTQLWLRSCETFAERLGTASAEVIKRPAALWAGRKPLAAGPPEDRLRLWLDAYHVRGSFDDRTLVVLHREALP